MSHCLAYDTFSGCSFVVFKTLSSFIGSRSSPVINISWRWHSYRSYLTLPRLLTLSGNLTQVLVAHFCAWYFCMPVSYFHTILVKFLLREHYFVKCCGISTHCAWIYVSESKYVDQDSVDYEMSHTNLIKIQSTMRCPTLTWLIQSTMRCPTLTWLIQSTMRCPTLTWSRFSRLWDVPH